MVAAASISLINNIAVFPKSLELLKENIFQSTETPAIPNTPKRLALPKELAVYRKEEVEIDG